MRWQRPHVVVHTRKGVWGPLDQPTAHRSLACTFSASNMDSQGPQHLHKWKRKPCGEDQIRGRHCCVHCRDQTFTRVWVPCVCGPTGFIRSCLRQVSCLPNKPVLPGMMSRFGLRTGASHLGLFSSLRVDCFTPFHPSVAPRPISFL